MKSVEENLEDYIWGRVKEKDYLEKVANTTSSAAEAILSRVSNIDADLNRKLRKGVEENLSRLLDQTTALESIEKRQRGVHAEMNAVKEGCDRIANSLNKQLDEYKKGLREAEKLFHTRNLIADALRCEELMDGFDKRKELVKRSEMVCELRAIVKENKQLLDIQWLRPTVVDRLKRASNEVQSCASNELQHGLETLNASLVSSATKALHNLGVLDTELETVLTRSVAKLDASLLDLAQTPASAIGRQLPLSIGQIQTHLEQAALLGDNHLAKFSDRFARTVKARVPVDSEYALRFASSLHRVLECRPSAVSPLLSALVPFKNAFINHLIARLNQRVSAHDFANAPNSSRFVEALNTAMEEELRQLEWDSHLHADGLRHLTQCFDFIATKIEAAIKLDESSLLLGDNLSATQSANYRLLNTTSAFISHWPSHTESLHILQSETTTVLVNGIRAAIVKILDTMHKEKLGQRELSYYMQELLSYISRVQLHASHAPSSLGRSDVISGLSDFTLLGFLTHASLIRARGEAENRQLRSDLDRLLESLVELNPSVPPRTDTVLLNMFTTPASQLSWDASSVVPSYVYIQLLVSESPPDLMSPHESVQWTVTEYARWISEQATAERLRFLSGLMESYTASVIRKGETEYVPNYPIIIETINIARKLIS